MRVSEQSQTLRPERCCEFGATCDVAHGLGRQAIHQVDIEIDDTGVAQPTGGALDQFERLDASDRLLHMRRGVLDAKTGAVNANCFKRAHQRPVDLPRVEFNGVFL